MIEHKKRSVKISMTGSFMTVLLMISFFLPRLFGSNQGVNFIKNIIAMAVSCAAIHLARKTSAMYFSHVWKNVRFFIMFLMPVFNLLIIALMVIVSQFVLDISAFFNSFVAVIILVLFSSPVFCCYYFSVLYMFNKDNKKLKIFVWVIDSIGILYFLFNIIDKCITGTAGATSFAGESISFTAPIMSFAVYIVSFVGFIICRDLFSGVNLKTANDK